MGLFTAETFYRPADPSLPPAAWCHSQELEKRRVTTGVAEALVLPEATAESPRAAAEVNHGRWVVRCPFCMSAQVAAASDQRFLCWDCGNAAVGGQWVTVVWPSRDLRRGIEDALNRRPPQHRHWLPHETVEGLEAETELHGNHP